MYFCSVTLLQHSSQRVLAIHGELKREQQPSSELSGSLPTAESVLTTNAADCYDGS